MGGSEIKIDVGRRMENIQRGIALKQAVLFVLPSLVITASSIVLFTLLTNFSSSEYNKFAVIIFLAIIISLLGIAGFNIFIYQNIGENRQAPVMTRRKVLLSGVLFGVIFSALMSALVYTFFIGVLDFSTVDFTYFSILLVLYSMTWAITATFWASGQLYYPAVIFTMAYIVILAVTIGFHRIDTEYTIAGYTTGVLLLFILAMTAALATFGRTRPGEVPQDAERTANPIGRSLSAAFFYTFYMLAVFLDKIIVWVYQGISTGAGPVVAGPYTTGAFLGMIPLFSVAVSVYFSRIATSLIDNRYKGTYSEIQRTNSRYIRIYQQSIGIILVVWAVLFILSIGFVNYFVPDTIVFRVTATISLGSLFTVIILHNSLVLVVFGKEHISTISVLLIILGEIVSSFFLPRGVWYVAFGFLCGSYIGFLVSQIYVLFLSRNLEFHMYRYLARFSGSTWK